MRTYLYVDGENFAIRARELDAELKSDVERTKALAALANAAVGLFSGHEAYASANQWSPEPHRSVAIDESRTRNGITYTKDEVYWDSLGLYIAIGTSMLTHRGQHQTLVDRAYYFTSAAGPNIDRHRAELHAVGFEPHVSVRVKPDSFAQEMAKQGITVVSRPKPVDILIATKVLDDAASNNFDLCIFVGGDEDYVPLLDAVRRRGKQVWLVAFEQYLKKDGKLRFTCDRFVPYDVVLGVRPLP